MGKCVLFFVSLGLTCLFARSSPAKKHPREERSIGIDVTTDYWGLRPRDCAEVQAQGNTQSGVYHIFVGPHLKPIRAYCDLQTEGGGWMVFQRREDGYENFQLDWKAYAIGFGDLFGEFWLGNHFLHLVTQQKDYKLRVELSDFDNNTRYAEYSTMTVAAPFQKYRLQLGNYSGDAGDAMTRHSGRAFSTLDSDNDDDSGVHCAEKYKAGWWYKNCQHANLNGVYHGGVYTSDYGDGINWYQWLGSRYSLKTTELKLRPVDFEMDKGV